MRSNPTVAPRSKRRKAPAKKHQKQMEVHKPTTHYAALTRRLTSMRRDFSAASSLWQQCSQPSRNDKDMDRYDIVGTTDGNELVKHRRQELVSPTLVNPHTPLLLPFCCVQSKRRGANRPPFGLFAFNFVKQFLYPLHNYLQRRFGLQNCDELQIALMPFDDESNDANNLHDEDQRESSVRRRDAFLATNTDRLTQKDLDVALKEWTTGEALYAIGRVVVVRDDPPTGRHAEQKLLDRIALLRRDYKLGLGFGSRTNAPRVALVFGERLPCVACRVYGRLFEDIALMLPSHGHFYFSTVEKTNKIRRFVRKPEKVHRLLCAKSRVLFSIKSHPHRRKKIALR